MSAPRRRCPLSVSALIGEGCDGLAIVPAGEKDRRIASLAFTSEPSKSTAGLKILQQNVTDSTNVDPPSRWASTVGKKC